MANKQNALINAVQRKILLLSSALGSLEKAYEMRELFFESTKGLIEVRKDGKRADLRDLNSNDEIELISQNTHKKSNYQGVKMSRKINFSAGPSAIPLDVLEHAKAEFTDYRGEGYSIMEISHRSKTFEEIHFGAMDKIRKLYGIGDEYEILFCKAAHTCNLA